MDRLKDYVRRFIISGVRTQGFLYLSDDLIFANNSVEQLLNNFFQPTNRTYHIPNLKKTTDRITALKAMVVDVKNDVTNFIDDDEGRNTKEYFLVGIV